MAEKQKENNAITPAAQPPVSAGQPAQPEIPTTQSDTVSKFSADAKMSKGEKLFNWGVYSGMNYWFNLGVSLVIGRSFIYGKGKNLVNQIQNDTIRAGVKNFSLNSGGWLLVVPLKFIEDFKRPIVHWMNKKMGVDQTAPDGHEMTPDEIYIEQEQPRQSWLRVLGRRTLASGSTVVAACVFNPMFTKKLDKPEMHNGKSVTEIGGYDRFTNFVVNKSNDALNSGWIPGGKTLAKKDWLQQYMSLAVLDIINTKVTALIMHYTNGAKKKHLPKEIGGAQDPQATPKEADLYDGPPYAQMSRPLLGTGAYTGKVEPRENFAALAARDTSNLSLSS